jgi:hypothetical protein
MAQPCISRCPTPDQKSNFKLSIIAFPIRCEARKRRFDSSISTYPISMGLALWRERRRAEIALAFISDAQQSARLWLVERLAALAREELRRKVFDR